MAEKIRYRIGELQRLAVKASIKWPFTEYRLVVECQDIDNGMMCQHIANKVL